MPAPPAADGSPTRSFDRAQVVLLALLATAFALRPLGDPDVWFHLAAGRLLWSTGHWPDGNTFSFTAADHPWIDLHWVFQLLLYAFWAVGGANGCIALAVLLVLTTVGVLCAAAARLAPPSVVVPLLALSLTIVSPRLVPRPELLSYVLIAAYLWLLERRPRGRLVYLLVPLQLLWVNSHGIFPVGIALIGCWWLGATLAFLPLPQGWREASGERAEEWRRLTLVLLLAAAVCLVNPYGMEGLRLPLHLLSRVSGGTIFALRIGEFLPPFMSTYARPLSWAWAGLLGATVLSFALNPGRWHLGRLLAVVAFGVLSTRALRNVALFAWIAVPAIAGNLGVLLEQRQAASPSRAKRRHGRVAHTPRPPGRVLPGLVTAGLALLLVAVVTNRFSAFIGIKKDVGLGVARSVPAAALEFLHEAGISGRPFNCLVAGDWMTWHRFPEERVFVDGRLEAYPEAHFATYFHTLDAPESWPEIAARYQFDYALLYTTVDRYPLARYLADGHGWTMAYHDETAALFLPVDEAHREMRERAERAFAQIRARRLEAPLPPPPGLLRRLLAPPLEEPRLHVVHGDFLRFLGRHREAARAYEEALVVRPGDPDIQLSLGAAYWFGGERERGVREWRDILRRHPDFTLARRALDEATGPSQR